MLDELEVLKEKYPLVSFITFTKEDYDQVVNEEFNKQNLTTWKQVTDGNYY